MFHGHYCYCDWQQAHRLLSAGCYLSFLYLLSLFACIYSPYFLSLTATARYEWVEGEGREKEHTQWVEAALESLCPIHCKRCNWTKAGNTQLLVFNNSHPITASVLEFGPGWCWDPASVIIPGVSPALPLQTAALIKLASMKPNTWLGRRAVCRVGVGHAAIEACLWQIRLKIPCDGEGDTGIIMGHSCWKPYWPKYFFDRKVIFFPPFLYLEFLSEYFLFF